jgi:hypothetical protein
LFYNMGNERFIEIARPTGSDSIRDGRGVAVADLNGDGRQDLVISNNNMKPTIYLNNVKRTGNWIELKLVGTRSNRDAIGARVRLQITGKTMTRVVEAGSGYASESMFPVHFGLGQAPSVEGIEIDWPSGQVQRFGRQQLAGKINQQLIVHEGQEQLTAVTTRWR